MHTRQVLLMGALGINTLLLGVPAHAQDDEDEYGDSDEEYESSDGDYESSESEAAEEDDEGTQLREAEWEPRPGKSHHYIGLRYRGIVVPQFMMNLFGDGGWSIYVNAFGPEYVVRRDDFEYNVSLWYADYAMNPLPFKGKNDDDTEWEFVTSEVKVLYLTADFLWSHKFSSKFAFNYGLGAGLGLVFGALFREQAYPDANDDDDNPYEWEACEAPGVPHPVYCADPDDEEHFKGEDGYREPSWVNGGSKPVVFPWLVFQTGLRYQPHKKFVARLDVGFGTSGFFFGLGADYGL
jgi:hypothetical protein